MSIDIRTKNDYNDGRYHLFSLKDPWSCITHLSFAAVSIGLAPGLLYTAFKTGETENLIGMILFMLGLVGLYSASGIYHGLDINEKVNKKLRTMDHTMIYMLIAGTYSPICLCVLKNKTGLVLFVIIWTIALIGIFQAIFFITCPKWFSSLLYIMMGWACVFAMKDLVRLMSQGAFFWLFAGGVIYTLGGVIYAIKMPKFNARHRNFGMHEIFHIFCICGSICHYIMMYYIV